METSISESGKYLLALQALPGDIQLQYYSIPSPYSKKHMSNSSTDQDCRDRGPLRLIARAATSPVNNCYFSKILHHAQELSQKIPPPPSRINRKKFNSLTNSHLEIF